MIVNKRNIISIFTMSVLLVVLASGAVLYASFYAGLEAMRSKAGHPGLKDEALKQALRHDRSHKSLNGLHARMELYLRVDNEGGWVYDRYTKTKIKAGRVPLPTQMLIEHTWPNSTLPNVEGHTDLHHLFPVSPVSHTMRRVLPFCDVRYAVWSQGGTRVGLGDKKRMCFEPPKDHKGDVARAMFYVSVMYEESIDPLQEKTLREWHDVDVPDAREKRRNDRVQKAQQSRNPFIDDPRLVKRISNF